MKFSNILVFASLAFASPIVSPRQQTVVGTITDAVSTLEDATSKNFAEIKKAAESVKNNVDATVEARVKTTLKTNYEAIVQAFKDATESITKVTTGAAGGVAGSAKGLTEEEVQQLISAIQAAQRIVSGVKATFEVTASDLTPNLKSALKSEMDAAKNVLAPFLAPLTQFASAAQKASASANIGVTGLQKARNELSSVVSDIAKTLGISSLQGLLNGALRQ